jgi:tRNA-uridine 2-sulfurtransferase
MKRARTLVAMSGGVDSSVAAALLVEQGHEVVGVTMKTFCYSETADHGKTCCGLDGITDARRVADKLGVPHYVFDVEEAFTKDVIDDFVAEYARGRTPNPCVRCNSNTKFADLLRRGEMLGCDGIASGHYVRIRHDAGGEGGAPETRSELLRGLDPKKDQSYFLWGLPRAILARLHFPLGHLTKPEVRAKARELGLVTAEKPESQEICFVPSGDYRDLLRRRLDSEHPALQPGAVVTLDGREVGEHDGYAGYTIGQRKGLGGGASEPLYVIELRPERREVVVGPRAALDVVELDVGDLNWLADPPGAGEEVEVQVRYRATAVSATVVTAPSGIVRGVAAAHREVHKGADLLHLRLHEPQRAVTPGQSAVIFAGDVVLGGGRIEQAIPAVRAAS